MSASQPGPRGFVAPPCQSCGAEMPPGSSICPSCGADIAMVRAPRNPLRWSQALAVPATIVLGAVLLIVATARLRAVGPGPDVATTMQWLVFGDGQRRPTLATLARGYETARAVLRCTLEQNEPCTLLPGSWKELASYSNAAWRGYVPLVMWAAPLHQIHGRVGFMVDVDGRDGWGRAWKTRLNEVQRPLEAPFYPGAVAAGSPPPPDRSLLHLDLVSAGADSRFGTADDITISAVFPGPQPLYGLAFSLAQRDAEIERAQVWFNWTGTDWDLIDARALAEWYLEQRTR